MALPMLISGADCGPVNPLQGLTKRFDQDRGIQQDQFGASRAGSSRQTFRTQQASNPALDQEAARFFAGNNFAAPSTSNAFDVSLMRNSLPPAMAVTPPVHTPSPFMQEQSKASSWATDFMKQRNSTPSPAQNAMAKGKAADVMPSSAAAMAATSSSQIMDRQWRPMMSNMQWNAPASQMAMSPPVMQHDTALWDKEFQTHEESLREVNKEQFISPPAEQQHAAPPMSLAEQDELAKTAGLLVDIVRDEQNPKFKNSQFLSFMRKVRDGEVVVDGNDMVERSEGFIPADVKGKGKERAPGPMSSTGSGMVFDPSTSSAPLNSQQTRMRKKSVHFDQDQRPEGLIADQEDEIDAYFRRDNDSYIEYWNNQERQTGQQSADQEKAWGAMQDSWDSFEATTWGVKPIDAYQFQPHNPYLHPAASNSRTRHHSLHSEAGFYESVLELEAAVQRDPQSASAWFDLGVKQQENEREPNAILALKRALELEPTHLPAWLALAISYTNENDRSAADNAIEQWVRRNPKYETVVKAFFAATGALNQDVNLDAGTSHLRHHSELVDCLMSMARDGAQRGEVDADVQIALAVLLNTSEDFVKAQDCFKAALSVRPEDWQLYNRVGATLANSGSAEEALQYYYRALELNPVYIRARFNLGISCINMRKYEEAAHHILDALMLQDSDGSVHGPDDKRGITSTALWDSLKTTCLHLQRVDLASLCDRKDLDGFSREFHA
ncbi:TPR-like protein [Schizopora paradoxa]|uniref:TPR-like protein n=1 Tax=Schizopora paradoxa TaxID=27342 RepID=A0A0H2RIF4_9AGAM|nr:TPR-like protein [Schizopora paradoxa]